MYKYGFQALLINQFQEPIDCGPPIGQCDILKLKYNFEEPFWLNLVVLAAIGIVLRFLALLVMHLVSNPKRVHSGGGCQEEGAEFGGAAVGEGGESEYGASAGFCGGEFGVKGGLISEIHICLYVFKNQYCVCMHHSYISISPTSFFSPSCTSAISPSSFFSLG
jgi:hypothetical protein